LSIFDFVFLNLCLSLFVKVLKILKVYIWAMNLCLFEILSFPKAVCYFLNLYLHLFEKLALSLFEYVSESIWKVGMFIFEYVSKFV
jgi:hypothetical protein